jgi:hypothetical protein
VIIWTWAALSQQSADNLDIRPDPVGRRDALVGLFVDDGSLALAIIVIVLLSSIFATLMPDLPLATGAVLLVGSLGVLFANVMKAAQR